MTALGGSDRGTASANAYAPRARDVSGLVIDLDDQDVSYRRLGDHPDRSLVHNAGSGCLKKITLGLWESRPCDGYGFKN